MFKEDRKLINRILEYLQDLEYERKERIRRIIDNENYDLEVVRDIYSELVIDWLELKQWLRHLKKTE